jgi:hypothetical protein
MPIILDIYNLIVHKKAVIEKYEGGFEQFRIDHKIPNSKVNTEDDELFSLGQMDPESFDIDRLISRGLTYDKTHRRSDDFTIVSRYEPQFWEVDWLEHNEILAWHKQISPLLKVKVDEFSNITAYEYEMLFKRGIFPLKSIRAEHIFIPFKL